MLGGGNDASAKGPRACAQFGDVLKIQTFISESMVELSRGMAFSDQFGHIMRLIGGFGLDFLDIVWNVKKNVKGVAVTAHVGIRHLSCMDLYYTFGSRRLSQQAEKTECAPLLVG